MVSSEMPELLGVCDRILVMSGGRLAGEVDAKNTSQEEILTLVEMKYQKALREIAEAQEKSDK